MHKWILDFEGYQVGTNFYPREVALLNTAGTNKCFDWHIGYSGVFARMDNNTTRCQFLRHGMSWTHGNMCLGKALEELRNVFINEQHIVYVKGREKTLWARHWFADDNVEVKEICNAPNFSDLMMYYKNCVRACYFHENKWHLRRARSKTYMLLPYV